MYEVEISIRNVAEEASAEFEAAGQAFVEELQAVPDLSAQGKIQKVDGTRGVLALLTGIVVTGVNLGAFAAIYVLAKDLYARYVNAEVELKFSDGSILKLKNLTQKEAEAKIRQHLGEVEQS